MPNFGSILKLLKYAPTVIGIIQQVRGSRQEQTAHLDEEIAETRDALADFKKNILNRVDDLEQENVRLKTRMREVESAFTMLRVLLYPIGVFALAAFVLALLALIRHV